jgi:hypothetical protein
MSELIKKTELLLRAIAELNPNLSMDDPKQKNLYMAFHECKNELTTPHDDYWETRCKLMEQIEENNPCDPDINQDQIEAWKKYRNFIKERGTRD